MHSIGTQLGIHKSTVSRELRRNQLDNKYEPIVAHEKAIDRHSRASRRVKKFTPIVQERLLRGLALQWSPDQIAGRARREGLSISHESLYRYIRKDRAQGGTLYKNLRHCGKPYKNKAHSGAGVRHIPHRVGIEERPLSVASKTEIGHWEGDLIIGANHKGAIITHVERHSKFLRMALSSGKTAAEVSKASIKVLKSHAQRILSITYDNGGEFAQHMKLQKALKAKVFFARPYASWERGLNEHTNGLVRQYFPKGTDLTGVCAKTLQKIEDFLNNRPRKVLDYRTPAEVFFATAT
jgi:IS30 family transposase